MADGGNSEPGEVNEKSALNLPLLEGTEVMRDSVCSSARKARYRIIVRARKLAAIDRRSCIGRIVAAGNRVLLYKRGEGTEE